MANDISDAFVAQYSQDVKLAFQREGSLLLSRVRRATGVTGSTKIFYKLGKGGATTKSRNGLVIPMNPDHTPYTATLADRYAPEYVDKLDEDKMSYEEKSALVSTGAWALGRAADDDIITVLDAATTNQVATGSADLTLDKIMAGLYGNATAPTVGLFARDVNDDGQVTCIVGAKQWGKLMQLVQFSSADYINNKPYTGGPTSSAKFWLNCVWLMHTGLTKVGNDRYCHFFHKNSIGHASGHEIGTEINYIAERVAHLVNSMMSMGAVVVDVDGITQVLCDESA